MKAELLVAGVEEFTTGAYFYAMLASKVLVVYKPSPKSPQSCGLRS
jgi:hypothetical protein